MAARSTAPEKRPGFFSQIRTLFTFTHKAYPWLPWLLVAIFLVSIAAGVAIGFLLPPVALWSIILWAVTGLMLGILASLMTMTRLSTSAMYKQIDGMPGAAGHVMSTSLGRNWQSSDMPVGVNPKTQEAVYRAVGRGGVVIVGEGARGRLTRLINDERSKAQRVATGVPVTVFYVGHGPPGRKNLLAARNAGTSRRSSRSCAGTPPRSPTVTIARCSTSCAAAATSTRGRDDPAR